jgi:hypothetical protein
VSSKPFPISLLTSLSPEACQRCIGLYVKTVPAFVKRTKDTFDREIFRVFIGTSFEKMEAAVVEAEGIAFGLKEEPPTREEAIAWSLEDDTDETILSNHETGVLIPPEISWQDGKSTGEIVSINYLLKTRDYLIKQAISAARLDIEGQRLAVEIHSLLVSLGVNKDSV